MAQGPAGGQLDLAAAVHRVAGARARLRGGSAALRAGLRPERVTRHLVAHPLLTIAGATALGFFAARLVRRTGPRTLRTVASAGPLVLGLARRWGPVAAKAWLGRTDRS